MRRLSLTLGSGDAAIAATAWLPDELPATGRQIVFVAFPGGGYSKEYFDLSFAGHASYSQAAHHAAAGAIVIGCDHLGVGQSSRIDDPTLTLGEIVDGDAAAVVEIRERLTQGRLVEQLPALDDVLLVGMGQSMGGCLTILMQGRHRVFDAIAVLGYSAIHTAVHYGLEQAGDPEARASPKDASLTRREAAAILRPAFFDAGVPEDIIAADFAGGYPFRQSIPAWGRLTPACVGNTLIQPGAVASEAAAVECPVFLGFGEIDLAANARAEPTAYISADDIELMIVRQCAHMHNISTGRERLWNRLIDWAARLSRRSAMRRVQTARLDAEITEC
jgi:pimeloyl-ACP methyl ester carboxylesterase